MMYLIDYMEMFFFCRPIIYFAQGLTLCQPIIRQSSRVRPTAIGTAQPSSGSTLTKLGSLIVELVKPYIIGVDSEGRSRLKLVCKRGILGSQLSYVGVLYRQLVDRLLVLPQRVGRALGALAPQSWLANALVIVLSWNRDRRESIYGIPADSARWKPGYHDSVAAEGGHVRSQYSPGESVIDPLAII